MKNRIENFLVAQLTSNLSVAILTHKSSFDINIQEYLSSIFLEVFYFDDFNDFVNIVKKQSFDMIFVDFKIKGINPFHLINEVRLINPFQIILGMVENESNEILRKLLFHRVNHYITYPLDTLKFKDAIEHCLDCVVLHNKEKLDKSYLQKSIDNDPISALKYLMETFKTKLEVVNSYKGVPISKEALLVDIVDQDVTLRVPDVQKYLIADLQHAILSSSFLYEDIYAYLKSINHEKNLITFTGLKYISSYIHHRKNLRVEPDKNFILSCSSNNGYKIFPLINISNEYALIKVENLNELFQINSELKLNFSFDMPLQSFIHKHIDCKAIVVDQFAFQGFHKVLFSLQLDFEQKQLLESYIYKRSLQIITELKKKLLQVK